MQDPARQIEQVVKLVTTSPSPDLQKSTFEKYVSLPGLYMQEKFVILILSHFDRFFTPDMSFNHLMCAVDAAPNSREKVLGIYQYVLAVP